MNRTAHLAAALLIAACGRTTGPVPGSCDAGRSVGAVMESYNDWSALSQREPSLKPVPALLDLSDAHELGYVEHPKWSRYDNERFCAGKAALADGTEAEMFWVLRGKGNAGLTGRALSYCIPGVTNYGCENATPRQ